MKQIITYCFSFAVFLLITGISFAQNVGISDGGSTFTPDNSSVLELKSTSRGFLIPRMTTGQRDAIDSKTDGLMIYNTTTKSVDIYNGTSFNKLGYYGTRNVFIGDSVGTLLTTGSDNVFMGYKAGDSVTTQSNNVLIGSNAARSYRQSNDVIIGYQAGYSAVGSASESVIIGNLAGYSVLSGQNVFIGSGSGQNSTSSLSVNMGYGSGANNSSGASVFLGYNAGNAATGIDGGVFIGAQAGQYNLTNCTDCIMIGNGAGTGNGVTTPTGNNNIFIGYNSGLNSTTGQINTFVGKQTGTFLTTGTNNDLFGYTSGYNINTGNYNTLYGSQAGLAINSGSYNVSIGYQSGGSNQTANSNTCIGSLAGYNLTSGNNTIIGYQAGWTGAAVTGNVFIGYMAGNAESGSNKLYIANSSTTTPLIYGEFDTRIARINGTLEVNVGTAAASSISFYEKTTNGSNYIQFIAPASLAGNTTYTLPSADGTAGQLLSTNGSGTLSWATNTPAGGIESIPFVFPNVSLFLGNQVPNFSAVVCRKTVVVTTIAIYIQAITTSSNFDVGIYDASATNNKLVSTGSFSVTSTGLKTIALSSPLALTAGTTYYLAIEQLDNNNGTMVYCYNNAPAGDSFFTFQGAAGSAILAATQATHNVSGRVPWICAY